MAPKRKGLGRGLDALIPNKINNTSAGSDEKSLKKPQTKKTVDVSEDKVTEKTEELQIPEQSAEVVISEPDQAESVQIDNKTEVKTEKNTDNESEKVLSVRISHLWSNRIEISPERNSMKRE